MRGQITSVQHRQLCRLVAGAILLFAILFPSKHVAAQTAKEVDEYLEQLMGAGEIEASRWPGKISIKILWGGCEAETNKILREASSAIQLHLEDITKRSDLVPDIAILYGVDPRRTILHENVRRGFQSPEDNPAEFMSFVDDFVLRRTVAASSNENGDGVRLSYIAVVNGERIQRRECAKWLRKIMFRALYGNANFGSSNLSVLGASNGFTKYDLLFLGAIYQLPVGAGLKGDFRKRVRGLMLNSIEGGRE